MAPDHLIGRTVTATLPQGTTITGTLRADRTAHVHVIDLGNGAEIMVHPDQTTIEEVNAPHSPNGRRHILADYQDKITDDDWTATRAIHEAAHAVIGTIVGLTLTEVWVGARRQGRIGGEARFESGSPQALAVHLMAGPIAQTKAVADLGYEPLVQAAVEGLSGQGDHATIDTRLAEGHVIWQAQADRDARVLLDTPSVWSAVKVVADALLVRGRLDGAAVRGLVGDPKELTRHEAWLPDL